MKIGHHFSFCQGLFQKLSGGGAQALFCPVGGGVLLTTCPRGGGNLFWGSRGI